MGLRIQMENRIEILETKVNRIEEALAELVQTKLHHIDLHEDINTHEEKIRKENNVVVEPDETFDAPTTKRKSTRKTKATATTTT